MAAFDLNAQFDNISEKANAASKRIQLAADETRDRLAADAAIAQDKASEAADRLKNRAKTEARHDIRGMVIKQLRWGRLLLSVIVAGYFLRLLALKIWIGPGPSQRKARARSFFRERQRAARGKSSRAHRVRSSAEAGALRGAGPAGQNRNPRRQNNIRPDSHGRAERCRHAGKIDKTRLDRLTKHRRVAWACRSRWFGSRAAALIGGAGRTSGSDCLPDAQLCVQLIPSSR